MLMNHPTCCNAGVSVSLTILPILIGGLVLTSHPTCCEAGVSVPDIIADPGCHDAGICGIE